MPASWSPKPKSEQCSAAEEVLIEYFLFAKPVPGRDQAEGGVFRIMLEFVNGHVLQHLMTAPIAGNRLLAERARKRIQSKV